MLKIIEMQISYADVECSAKRCQTRRDRFLAQIESVTRWALLISVIEPRYYGRLRARASWADAIERHRSAIIDQVVSELRVAIDRSARVRAIYRD